MIAKIFEPLLKEIWEQEGFARWMEERNYE
jgi:hypothetical protein